MSSISARLSARVAPIRDRISNEPVAAANGAVIALGLAASFGLPITPDQKLELGGVLVVAANWWARSKVVPTNKLVSGTVTQPAAGQPVTVTAPNGAATVIGGGS